MKLTQKGNRKLHSCLIRMAIRGLDRWGPCFDRLDYGAMIEPNGALIIKGRFMLGGEIMHFQGSYPAVIQFLNDYLDGCLGRVKHEAGLL
jgi:hypothetical protein